jgi:hypothetical protein
MAIQLKPTKPGPLWRFLSSVWLGISLMLVTALMAGLGHFFGFKETEEIFFGSWWFSGLMLTLALNLTIATLDRAQASAPGWFPYRLSQIPWLMLHTGLVIVILGGVLTKGFSQDGQIYIQEGTSERTILMNRQELIVDHVKAGARETETKPIKLTHLPQSDDLSKRKDMIAWIGRAFWLLFGCLAGGAALLISRSRQVALRVLGFFVVTGIVFDHLASKAADFTRKVPGASLTFERYLPHHTVTHPIVADPSGAGPRAVEVGVTADMGGRPVGDTRWIPLMHGQAFTQEELQLLADAGQGSWDNLANGVLLAVQQVGTKEELEQLLAGKPSVGHAEITAGGETKRVALDPLVKLSGDVGRIDTDVVVGGHTLRLQQFMWKLEVGVESNIARDAAPGGPLGPTACLRVASVTYPDGKLDAPPRPYHSFAFPEIRGLARDMAQPAGVSVKLELPTWAIPPGRCVHVILGPEPGAVRLFTTGFESSRFPTSADEVLKTKPASPEGDKVGGLKMPLVFKVKQLLPSVMRTSEFVAAERDDPNFDKYPDAVFVRLRPDSDPKKELTGWLPFAFASDDPSSKLFLQDGDEVWTIHYRAQRRVLPFEVFLRDFRIRWAPGSENVREEAFESTVTVSAPKPAPGAAPEPTGVRNASFDYDIYMNHTLEHEWWTLFQSSYIKGPPGSPDISVFAVQNDPGKWPFYVGSLALSLGVFGIFFVKPKLRQIELARRGQAPRPVAAAEPVKVEAPPPAVGTPVPETVPPTTAEAKPAEPPVA